MGPSGCGKSSAARVHLRHARPGLLRTGVVRIERRRIIGSATGAASRSASCSRTTCCFRTCRSATTWPSRCRTGARRATRRAAVAQALARGRPGRIRGRAIRDALGWPARARRADAHPARRAARAAARRAVQQAGRASSRARPSLVLDHARRSALPILLVTHDPADAEAAGGPVIGLPDSQARALCRGTSAVVDWRERRRMLWSGVARRGHVLRITGTGDRP